MATPEHWVWWEAESAEKANFDPEHPFIPKNDLLSGGEWIGVGKEHPSEKTFAEYTINVPETGEYRLYTRKFWKHGPFRYQFGDGEWTEVGRDIALMDSVSLQKHLSANWVDLGSVHLEKGSTQFRIELLQNEGAAAFDAFLLSSEPFSPRGSLKPGEKYGRAPKGWFPFEPDRDNFTGSPIDLRRLNEAYAGQNGFIETRDDQFIHGDSGQPVKFWAANINRSVLNMSRPEIDHLAKGYAKRGVNLVRYHSPLFSNDQEADPEVLDKLFYTVAAFKREGIYLHLSIYFQHWNTMNKEQGKSLYLEKFGYEEGQRPYVLHFINRDFQAIMKGWWSAVLTTANPYTGTTLARDPAVMGAELINEDNYFFHTFTPDRIPRQQMKILEKRFGDWVAKRYGSIEKALKTWDQDHPQDAPDRGQLGLPTAWEMGNQTTKRNQSAARFLAEDERAFFTKMQDYLKEDLGFGGVITATNWKTAEGRVLDPVEKWANSSVDFMDHHGYYGAPFQEKDNAFGFGVGDQYQNRTATRFEGGKRSKAGERSFDIPFNILIWDNKPHMLSEIAWPVPNRYRGEQALLGALLGTLQGLDAIVWFATDSSSWTSTLASNWPIQNPAQAGQWPAAALIYRQNLIQPAAPSMELELGVESILDLEGMPVAQSANLDAMQAKIADAAGDQETAQDELQQLAFFVGPITIDFKPGDQQKVKSIDLTQYIDLEAGTVRSQTGEMVWDWEEGLVLTDAPKAQVAIGAFSQAETIDLSGMRLESPMEYGIAALVPLDDQPIADSKKLLLQVFSEDTNFGWETSKGKDGWLTIESEGDAPIVVRDLKGTVHLKRSDAAKLQVTALDFNGYPKQTIGRADKIELQPDTLYYLIEKP